MSSPPPLISNHRLARLALWLLALLAWFVLGGQGSDRQRRRVDISFVRIERAVRDLILIRAAQLLPLRKSKPRRHHAPKPTPVRLRAVGGVWLRQRLSTRGDLVSRAAQLLAALRNWRKLAASLARRRAAGFTRLVRTWFAADRAIQRCVPAAISVHAADTS